MLPRARAARTPVEMPAPVFGATSGNGTTSDLGNGANRRTCGAHASAAPKAAGNRRGPCRLMVASILLFVFSSASILSASSAMHARRLSAAPEVSSSGSSMQPEHAADLPPSASADSIGSSSRASAPPSPPALVHTEAVGASGAGNPALARLHATAAAAAAAARSNGSRSSLYTRAHFGVSNASDLPPTEVRQLRRRYHGRKFLFPLLDQGPNNQFLQFRVALAKARQLNRTLCLLYTSPSPRDS